MTTFKYTDFSSTSGVLHEMGQRLTRRRIALNLTQAELAKRAGVGKRTLERLEAGGSTQLTNFLRILRELELLDEFIAAIPDDQPSPMEQLRAQGKKRKRVRHKKKPETDNTVVRDGPTGWTWGE